jgi:hypothetical protein
MHTPTYKTNAGFYLPVLQCVRTRMPFRAGGVVDPIQLDKASAPKAPMALLEAMSATSMFSEASM